MFTCLRALALLAPLAVVAGLVWLAGQARMLSYRDDADLVVAVQETPARFNPLMPGRGAEREITELVFDRLLRLDDDLRLRPHLLERWEYRHRATCYFLDAGKAAAAAAVIDQSRDRWSDWLLEDFVLDGDQVHLISGSPERRWLDEILNGFDRETIAPLLQVRLTLRSAVAQSLGDFLAGSVEKGKLRHLDYDGDRVAHLYLQGETDLFLKELRLYYESNRNLEPEIEVMGPVDRIAELDWDAELRGDLRWHDGTPATADDLVYTFEEVTRPGSPWPLREAFGFVESMEKVDERKVRVHCREFYAPAPERWAKLPLLPAHLLSQAVGPDAWERFFARPVGTGPYRLRSAPPEGPVVLEANVDYFRGAPRQGEVRYLTVTDFERRRLDWRLGKIDVLAPASEQEWHWLFETGAKARPSIPVDTVRDAGRFQSFVAWNLDRDRFTDPRVRRGLAYLIDVEKLLATLPEPRPRAWKGLFFPGSWFCQSSPGPLAPDADLAAVLFGEAGWKRDEGGKWRTREGRVVDLTLSYDRADLLHARLAEHLAERWNRAGIDVKLEALDWRALLEERLATREFDALLLSWELDFSRDHFAVWHSSEAGPGGSNFSGLRNQQVDGLLEKLRRERDEAAVIATATELQDLVRELQPCLFLCSTGRELAFRKDAVEQARPASDGTWNRGPIAVGRAGLFASRPWWVRVAPGAPANPEPDTTSPTEP